MKTITLAAVTAAIFCLAASSTINAAPVSAPGLQVAQAEVQIGRDRDRDRDYRDRRDVTIGVGPGGVRVGPREHCRTVTTTVTRDDGRTVTRKERRCD
jgi:hypothetical protein